MTQQRELKAKKTLADDIMPTADWAEPFKVISVTKSAGPEGNDKKDWYRYVISQGNDPIIGFRRGTRQSVVAAAEAVVFSLNERLVGKRGRAHIKYRKK